MKLPGTILHWTPRIMGIGFVLFVSLFALDVFSEYSGRAVVVPLLIHLVPSVILLAAVAIAWRFELAGALIFAGFAVFYVWNVGLEKPWSWYAAIAGPAGLVGILFFLSWLWKRRRTQGTA